ncbi:MAG TPA: DUF4365 domain-containing protein [Bryobacteraceae bacterium]|nr:DUF4365 domain-containing protein [Bryobacteraceae bacterium]
MHLTHRQEQFSNAFIEAVAAVAGCSAAQNSVDNDSIDWTLSNRLPRRPKLDIQLKCTCNAGGPQENIRFPLPIKNYRDLILPDLSNPRILVVVVVPEEIEGWMEQTPERLTLRRCAYWVSLLGLAESDNENTVTVDVPRANLFTVDALSRMMQRIDDRQLL